MNNQLTDNCYYCSNDMDIGIDECPGCEKRAPKPRNVRRSEMTDEQTALNERYVLSMEVCRANGLFNEAYKLESYIRDRGEAVINTSREFVWLWLEQGTQNYIGYRRQILEGKRKIAQLHRAIERSSVDTFLFGEDYDFIYSALSLTGVGLLSYGDVSVALKPNVPKNRASAIEENSFDFFCNLMEKGGWTLKKRFPKGYISSWANVSMLAFAKLHGELAVGMNESEISKLVLYSEGNRASDKFIELHIDGKIIASSVEKIIFERSSLEGLSDYEEIIFRRLQKKHKVIING